MTTLPLKLAGPATRITSSVAVPSVAMTTISPKRAASLNVAAFAPNSASFDGVREPILMSWPRVLKARAKDLPTSPLPKMPIFMAWSLSLSELMEFFHHKEDEEDEDGQSSTKRRFTTRD